MLVIAVAVPSDTAAGTITNNVFMTSATSDPVAANDSTSEGTTVALSADVGISKADDVDPVTAGSALTYTVTVDNSGPSDASGVVMTDALPAGVTFTSATPDQGSCSESAGTVTCLIGTIASGASVDVVIVVGVNPDVADGTVLTNVASVTATSPDPDGSNNGTSEQTTVVASADLSVSKLDSVDPVEAGSGLSYAVTVANSGSSDAQTVVLIDVLPAEVTFVSATPDQGSCSESGGTVTCSLGSVAGGASVDVVIVVAVDSDTAAGTIINNASVSSVTSDPVAANDSTSEDTAVETQADLSVSKVDSADPVNAGSGFFYTVTVANVGPSDAQTVVLADVLPTEVSFVSATPDQGSCSESGGTVTCSLGTVASGGSVDVVIAVAVPSDTAAGTIINNASVSSATSDPVAANNSTSEDTMVATSADLSVAKVDSADPVNAGSGFFYTVTVANVGPSDAQTVVLTDTLPVEVAFVSAAPDQGSCSESGGTVTCLIGTIADGASVDVVIVVTVDSDTAAGTITNNASVTSVTSDPVAGDDSTSEDTTVLPAGAAFVGANLSVSKVDSVDPVSAGDSFSYTVTVANSGPSDAGTVVLADTLPVEVAFVSAAPDQGSCSESGGTVTCSLGSVADGASVDVVIVVTVPAAAPSGTITNNASVASSTGDPDASNDATSEDTIIGAAADLSVSKADSADPVTAGTGFSYSVTVANSGPSDAATVLLTDVLPAGAAFVGATPDQGSCSESSGTVTCALGTIANGLSVDVVIAVTVDPDTAPGTITNNASVSSATSDPTASNNSTFEDTTVTASADLAVIKVDTADPVNAGDGFAYAVTVTNNGPSDAQTVVLTDVLPAEVTYVSATPDQGSCSEVAGTVTCGLGTIAAGVSVDVVIAVTVDSDTPAATITNVASVTSATFDPAAANDSTSEDTTITTSADLSVAKVDSADPVDAGAAFSYTVTVSNAGPSDASTVILTDVLPVGVAFVSATPDQGSCSESAGTVTCGLGTVADGVSADVLIAVTVPSDTAAGTIINNASVSSATSEPVGANDTASEDTTITTSADLSVAKADSADPVVAGTAFLYTVTVANAGPSDASTVVLTDVLPAGVAFVSATPDQGSCSESAGTVTCGLGTVAAGVSVDVVIAVTVDSDTPAGTITNNASVSSATSDPVGANDTASEDTTVTTSADLSVIKSDSPDGVLAGATLTYTLDVSNAGPSDAQTVVATDVLPVGVVYVSATVSGGFGPETCSESAGTVTCALGSVLSGSTETITIVVTVDGGLAERTVLTNNASVSTASTDPDGSNDSDSEDTTVVGVADVSISKTDSIDPVIAGTNLTYGILVNDLGPGAADGVVVSDTLPTGTSFVSAVVTGGSGSESCSEAAGVVSCILGDVSIASPETITLVVAVGSDVVDGTILSNTASVTSITHDPIASNDSDTEATNVSTAADLSIVKSDSADPVTAGTNFSYSLNVSNAGPSDATSVDVTDVLPAGVSYVSGTVSGGSGTESCNELGGVVSCDLGLLGNGASESISIVVSVDPSVADGSVFSNNASVSSATSDPAAANDSASEDTTITTTADLSLVKVDSVDPVVAGAGFSYTVTVTNAGPSDAATVVLTDVLPVGITYVSATPDQGSCSESAGTVTCGVGTVSDGASVDVVIAVTVDADTPPGTISNIVSISSATSDPSVANDSASEDTTITTSADLSVVKVDSADPVDAGDGFSYTVTVANAGPSDAQTVVLTDVLPAEVSYLSATPDQGSCSETSGTVTCSLGTIAAGAAVDVVITVTVDADTLAGTVTNSASVSSAASDPVAANDSASEDTTITTSVDLSVVKIDSVDPVTAGTGLSYTVTVTNAGPSDATTVLLTDVLPVGVTYLLATPDQGSCSESVGTVTCALGSMADGASIDVVIAVTVDAGTSGTITNNASVTAATSDPNGSNDSTSEDTIVTASADVGVTKVDSADPLIAGTGFAYTVTVTNGGPSDAGSVVLTDVLPAEVSYLTAILDQGTCSEAAGTVTCSLGTIASGASVDVVIAVTVPSDLSAGTVTNNASISTTTTDSNGVNDATSEDTTITTSADLAVSKVDSVDPATSGAGFAYTVTVTNIGPSDATSVVMTDVLPAAIAFVSASPDQGPCSEAAGTVTCSIGTIIDGDSVDITISVAVPPDATPGTITNNAAVTAATNDPIAGNDSTSEDTTIVGSADLSITKTDSVDPVTAGTGFAYTVTVANAGPSDSVGAVMTDVLPSGSTFVGATPDQGSCSESGGTVTCLLGTIANGASADIVISVAVPSSTVAGSSLVNNAAVTATTTDPDGSNDATSESTLVVASADLSIVKVDGADPVTAGEALAYTITVSNAGPSDAVSVASRIPSRPGSRLYPRPRLRVHAPNRAES